MNTFTLLGWSYVGRDTQAASIFGATEARSLTSNGPRNAWRIIGAAPRHIQSTPRERDDAPT
jgi:hypothetical protein